MKKYMTRAAWYNQPIQAVEVENETDCFVVINGRRRKKRSDYCNYFNTYDEAKAFLRQRAERAVSNAQSALDTARNELAKIRALQPKDAENGSWMWRG